MQDQNKKLQNKTSSSIEAKVKSLIITLILSGIIVAFLTSYKITYNPAPFKPVPLNKSDTLNLDDIKSLEDKINTQKSISDSLTNDLLNLSRDLNKNTDSVTKGETPIPAKEEDKKTSISNTKNTPKKEEIGNGRKLIKFIPGTMGAKGSLPKSNCNGSGTIVFSYLVDKNGHILSVTKKSGTKNTCLTNVGIGWIKKYVKVDVGTKAVSGTYTIVFK